MREVRRILEAPARFWLYSSWIRWCENVELRICHGRM